MERNSKRDHVLRESLSAALTGVDFNDVQDIVDKVLRTLSQQRMILYAPAGELPILTTHGRILVAVMEDPDVTLRALAVYLGTSESNVQKSLKALCDMGFITKTKVKTTHRYKLSPEKAFLHPDITRLFDGIVLEIRRRSEKGDDIRPE